MTAPQHPGVLLLATLAAMGMSQAGLARRTELSAKHINQVCQGVANISARSAVRLEEATGVPAETWLQLQCRHDLVAARTARVDEMEAERHRESAARAAATAAVHKVMGGAL